MKHIFSIVLFFMFLTLNAQVGINTNSPRASLDIQGALTLRGNLRTGGNDINIGSSGRNTNILVSNGDGKLPEWKSLKIPVIKPERYYLLYTNSFNDRVGSKPTVNTGSSVYNYGMNLPSNWSVIQGLTKEFTVTNPSSKAFFLYESVAHINSTKQYQGVNFACGIFVDNSLIGVRALDVNQPTNATAPFVTFTIFATTEKTLSVGTHEAKVACTKRTSYENFNGSFSVGSKALETTNIDDFMAQSLLKIDVYEIPTKFSTIIKD